MVLEKVLARFGFVPVVERDAALKAASVERAHRREAVRVANENVARACRAEELLAGERRVTATLFGELISRG